MNQNFHLKKVLVVGGTGFIGRHLVNTLIEHKAEVSVLSRHASSSVGNRYKVIQGDLTLPVTYASICRNIDIVFYLSGHAHAFDQLEKKSETLNWQVTVEGVRTLLDQAIQFGVTRFIFFSSVKAMGEGGEVCLDETAPCLPRTSYGRAKLEAEKLVVEANHRGLASTILRLPMVYGPGCKGNLPRMIYAVARGRFPPLPETGNRRSLIDVRDVVQAALLAAVDAKAIGKTYIATDGQIYSTRQIYEWICAALNHPIPAWTVPLLLLRWTAYAGDIIGQVRGKRFMLDTAALDKLLGSACYDSKKISHDLGYRPVYSLKNSLIEMVAEYKNNL